MDAAMRAFATGPFSGARLLTLACSLAVATLVPALVPTAARAESETLLTVLSQIPADAAIYDDHRVVDLVDVAALRRATGLPDGIRLTDLETLPEADEALVMQLLLRMTSSAEFPQYLQFGAASWSEKLGADFLEVSWFSQPGTPPGNLLLLGGETIGVGDSLQALESSGFAPQERDGETVWVKGEKDAALDVGNRQPGFPFWGQLGANARLFRSDEALVGARTWPSIALAMAAAAGEAESLADLPRFRLAAQAAADPAQSDGPVLQTVFVDEAFGKGVLAVAPSPDGLPPFGLYAVADREDASGHQVLLLLTYDDAITAEAAAALLAARLPPYRPGAKGSMAERFPGLQAQASVFGGEEGAVAVVRLSTPPEPALDEAGRVQNRSRLYRLLYLMLLKRDLGFLSVRE